MSLGDWIAIASFALTIAGLIFYLGKLAYRFERVEKDLNQLGKKVESQGGDCNSHFEVLDSRLDRYGEFVVRVDQRVAGLESRVYGEETLARIRGMDS